MRGMRSFRVTTCSPCGNCATPVPWNLNCAPAGPTVTTTIMWCSSRYAVPRTWTSGATATIFPPGLGLFVPASVEHVSDTSEDSTLTAVYVRPSAWQGPAGAVRDVTVNAATRELLLHLAYRGMSRQQRFRAQRLCLEFMAEPGAPGLELPLPRSPLIQPITRQLLEHPEDARSLDDWAWLLATSGRTIARAFRSDTGMTFSEWRTVARMSAAVRLLGEGTPVGTVSRRVGYTSPSAFATALKRITGRGPQDFRTR